MPKNSQFYSLHCFSCKRYVVVTHRSIILTSCKKHVSYTCNFGEWIKIETEELQNEQILFTFPTVYFYPY